MKKLYLLIFVGVSSLLLSQSWQYDPESNPFNNSNKKPYEDISRKKEIEINQEMSNVRNILRKSEDIYNSFQTNTDESEDNQNAFSSGPGAPGEPVPIDGKITLLFMISLGMIVFYSRKIKHKRLT